MNNYLNTFSVISISLDRNLNFNNVKYEYYNDENIQVNIETPIDISLNHLFNDDNDINNGINNSYWILFKNNELVGVETPFLSNEDMKYLFAGPFSSKEMMNVYLNIQYT